LFWVRLFFVCSNASFSSNVSEGVDLVIVIAEGASQLFQKGDRFSGLVTQQLITWDMVVFRKLFYIAARRTFILIGQCHEICLFRFGLLSSNYFTGPN
jgi:hypothetical protein